MFLQGLMTVFKDTLPAVFRENYAGIRSVFQKHGIIAARLCIALPFSRGGLFREPNI